MPWLASYEAWARQLLQKGFTALEATLSTPPPARPLPYQAAYEQPEEDEAESIAELEKVFVGMAKKVAEKNGHAFRAVHDKGQGLLRGRLVVVDGLPPELAQGIFAAPATFDVLLRLSSPPAEQLPDAVSTPRALALKVLGVPGPGVDGTAAATQDFLMVNGPAFVRSGPKGFLKDAKLLALTTEKAPQGKKVISAMLRGVETALEAVGGESAKIKNMGGQPPVHPLGETYFSQAAFLYGAYMAKFSIAPVSPALLALKDQPLELDHDDAQRAAVNDFFAAAAQGPAEWELRVQLCTDIAKMPIEDVSVEWPQELSPYVAVARIIVPPQVAWDPAATQSREDDIAFDPWHAVAAHRPLGAVNRARKVVMASSRRFRSEFNGCPIHEPPPR